LFEEDEQSLVLLHFTWSGLDVSCCMGNAWVGPSGLFFSRHMGCKLAVRQLSILVHLIAIAVPRPFSSAWSDVLLQGRLLLFDEDEQDFLFCCISRGLLWT
jgi:hypothetical protein